MPRRLAIWVPLARRYGLGHYHRNAALVRACEDAFYLTDSWEVPVSAPTVLADSLDPEKLEAQLHELQVGALLVDHYFLPRDLVARLASSSTRKYRIMLFDRDYENPKLDALLNSNPFCKSSDFEPRHPGTRYFVGGHYLWLRPEIADCPPLAFEDKHERLLVCMGGSDRQGLLRRLLPELRSMDLPLVVVVGAGCKADYAEQLRELTSALHLEAEILHDPPDFAAQLNVSRFALIPTSTLSYEALHLGCRVVALQTEEHQERLARFLREQRLPVFRPDASSELREALECRTFRALKLDLGSRAQELVDYVREALAA